MKVRREFEVLTKTYTESEFDHTRTQFRLRFGFHKVRRTRLNKEYLTTIMDAISNNIFRQTMTTMRVQRLRWEAETLEVRGMADSKYKRTGVDQELQKRQEKFYKNFKTHEVRQVRETWKQSMLNVYTK